MSPFDELLNKVYDGDPDKATEDIMSALKLSKYQREFARAPFRYWVGLLLKNEAVRTKAVALGAAEPKDAARVAHKKLAARTAEAPAPTIDLPKSFDLTLPQLRALLPVEFAVGGRRVTWGTATVNDFRAAKAAHDRAAKAHMVHSDQMGQAIRALERSGCDTLGELFSRPVAA